MFNGQTRTGGLSSGEIPALRQRYGKNQLAPPARQGIIKKALHTLREPMFLLLIIAAIIYFLLGEPRDGLIMLVFVMAIISIDVIQEWKTDKTLSALKELTAPHIGVIRDGRETSIASVDLLPGDIMLIQEGVKIPADGIILKCSDLCVDESSLTGEAEGVWKASADTSEPSGDYWRKDYCYAGTLVIQGSGAVCVDKIGAATEYGKIGAQVSEAADEPTPLQRQTRSLVKLCAGLAALLLMLVGAVTWFNIPGHSPMDRLVESILAGITLAMAMIPEEFPVILTVFLSMGAWRLAKQQSLVHRLPCVETLGAVSVLCVDKTGTITMNQMTVREVWAADANAESLCETMGLACETDPYDPMERAMLAYCEQRGIPAAHLFGGALLTEYAFTHEQKIMGHVWHHDDEIIIAAKGSPERLLSICQLPDHERVVAEGKIQEMGERGLRVIAVAKAMLPSESDIPSSITDCTLSLCGLVGLADPPRASVKADIALCHRAGIRVVMITGDSGVTASSIAGQIGMKHTERILTGDMLEAMSDERLRDSVRTVNIFSRVIPEHKMRIVRALKANGEIVAMTGDGVNDAPALKYADIGIAMGKRGSEVSREAADIILMDDNFSTIVDTVKDGRRIYDNIRKAIGYVFAIHIPIALTSLLAPLLGIYPASLMLLPLHIVLLELIIDPTCSIVLERQPAEDDIMGRKPRNPRERLLGARTLIKSILQGLTIFAASFGVYVYMLAREPGNAAVARSMGLAVMVLANMLLVQVNSSDTGSVIASIRRLAKDWVMWAVNAATALGLVMILYTPLSGVLKLAPLSLGQIMIVLVLAAASVLWYETVKWAIRRRHHVR